MPKVLPVEVQGHTDADSRRRCLNEKELKQMKATVGAFATVLVTVWQAYPLAQPAPVGQLGPESVILRRAAANILDVEPAWRFGSAICNCAPLTDEQVGVAAGSWRQPGNGSLHSIDVRVHAIAHPQAASQWIDRAKRGSVQPDGWTIASCHLGDGCYTATYQDGRRHEVNFRK